MGLICYNSYMPEIVPLIMSFFIAWIGVPIFGFVLYLAVSRFRATAPWGEVAIRRNVSFKITIKLLPLINLVFWVFSAWIYFSYTGTTIVNALLIGGIWVIVAAMLDYVVFILIKQPLSVDRKGFYIDQAPWIYLTYFAVFISPIVYVGLFS